MIDKVTTEPRAWSKDLTHEEYLADDSHDSNSSLRMFEKSPGRYYHMRVTKRIVPPPSTSDQIAGTACHAALLEPAKVDRLLIAIPPEVLSSNGSKAGKKWEEWRDSHPDKIHLKQAELDLLRWQIDSVWNNPACKELLESMTIPEHSIYWHTPEQHKLKCRFDIACELQHMIADVKTTRHDWNDFWKAVRDYGYHCQAALYCDGYRELYGVKPKFRFLLVRDEPPFESCVCYLPKEAMAVGRQRNAETLQTLYACKRGERPWTRDGYDQVRALEIPDYFYSQV